MTRPAAKPEAHKTLIKELAVLVGIDERRNTHTAALTQLQSRRDVQVGRMQVIAEQAGIDLERWVTEALAERRRAS